MEEETKEQRYSRAMKELLALGPINEDKVPYVAGNVRYSLTLVGENPDTFASNSPENSYIHNRLVEMWGRFWETDNNPYNAKWKEFNQRLDKVTSEQEYPPISLTDYTGKEHFISEMVRYDLNSVGENSDDFSSRGPENEYIWGRLIDRREADWDLLQKYSNNCDPIVSKWVEFEQNLTKAVLESGKLVLK